LKASGYSSVFATDGITAVSVARKELPDLIILDIGLPGGDGFTVLERLKSCASLLSTPTIVASTC
jgi:two-component system alkaline phosphatase synthesis response regulator PhoP